jgi:hypothetical protein
MLTAQVRSGKVEISRMPARATVAHHWQQRRRASVGKGILSIPTDSVRVTPSLPRVTVKPRITF